MQIYRLHNINIKSLLLISILLKLTIFYLFIYFNETPFKYEYDYQELIDNFYVKDLNFNLSLGHERLPLYQIFLFFVYSLFKSKILISLTQIILSTFNLLIIYKIGKLFNKEFALILVSVAVFNPGYNLFSFILVADFLFLLFSLIFIYYFCKFLIKFKLRYATIAFIVLGLMSLTKPIIIYFPFFLTIFLIFFQKQNKIKTIILLLSIFYLINGSWILRNSITYGDTFYTSQDKTNIINWYLPLIEQEDKKIDLDQAKKNINDNWIKFKIISPRSSDISEWLHNNNISKNFFFNQVQNYSFITILKSWSYGSIKTLFLPYFFEYKQYFEIKKNIKFSTISGGSFIDKITNYISNLKFDTYYTILLISLITTFFFRYVELINFFNFFNQYKKIYFFFLVYAFYFLIIAGPIGSARYRLPLEILFIFSFSNWIYSYKINRK